MRVFTYALLVSVSLSTAALAQGLGVAASVNDEAISSLDVENRLAFVLSTSRLTDSEDTRARLRPQILRGLIIEALQTQEARKNGITVNQADLDGGMALLEKQRGLAPGELTQKLDEAGISRDAFLSQLTAQLYWNKLVMQKVRPKIKISDDELDRERGKAKNQKTSEEVQLEILGLPVDKPESEPQVRGLAEKLNAELKKGASFESLVTQLGNASGIAQVKPTWVQVGDLDPAIASVVQNAKPGEIADPVRTPEGYTIVRLLNRRSSAASAPATVSEVVVKDILLKLKSTASKSDVDTGLGIAQEIAKNPGDCASNSVAGVSNPKDYDIFVEFRRETQASMPDALRDIVGTLQVGGVSQPYASYEGIRLFMLCERVDTPAPLADREETYQRVMQQKLELEAQKYLRTLKRDAYIEIRG